MTEQARHAALLRAAPALFVLIWSTGFVVARYAMPHAPPLTFLSWRYVLSIACFIAWARLVRAPWPQPASQRWHLAVSGVLMHAGYLGGVWTAIRHGAGAGTIALIVGLQPLLTAVWVSASGGRDHRVNAWQWGGLLLGFGGLALVVWHKLGGELSPFNLAMAIGALISITVGTLYQKRFVVANDVRTANCVQLVAALAVSAPLALFEDGTVDLHPELFGAMTWSVFVLTLGGSSLLLMLIQRGAATRVTSLMYLVPPCTALLAALLFGEPLTASMLAGLVLTALGVWLVVR